MKTLVVTLADLEDIPHGTASSRTSVDVTAHYTGPVTLEDGTIIPPAIKAGHMSAMGVWEFEVHASDSPLVKDEYQGFAVVVNVVVRQTGPGHIKPVNVTRTVKPLMATTSPVSLGKLAAAEPVPAQWVTAAELISAMDGGAGIVRVPTLVAEPTFTTFGAGGWSYLGSTATRSGDTAVVTGTGAISGIGLYTDAAAAFEVRPGHRYFVQAEMTVPAQTTMPTGLSVSIEVGGTHTYVGGTTFAVSAPLAGQRYTISGVVTPPAGASGRLYLRAFFPSGTSNGAKVHLHPATVLDLTAAFPLTPEPDQSLVSRLVSALPGGYVSPSQPLPISKPVSATDPAGAMVLPKARRESGPHVAFRFDDGYLNNLTIAAPILARYGYVGTLVACSHPTEWLGTVRNGYHLMTGAQLKRLHEVYGWEIGAHMPKHEDAIATPLGTWVSALMDNIDQLKSHGLPRPTTFAYPNGSRNASTDRYVYAMFDQCGLTGGPERIPWPYDKGTFYSGWCAVGGISEATADIAVEKCKKYIASSMNEGRVAVVGIHGITHEDPTVDFFLRADKFTALVQWVWEQGYPVSTMSDVPNHNMLADGGFMDYEVTTPVKGSYPWMLNSGGWSRQFGTGIGRVGMRIAGNLPASPIWYFEQRASVEPGREYRVYVHHTSTVTAGSVRVRAYPMTVLGDAVGGGLLLTSITATGSTWLTGTFTAPAGAHTVRINVSTDGGSGANGDFLVDAVAMFPTDTYDPLA